MSRRLNYEKANRTKKSSWSGSTTSAPLYSWHRRNNKFPKRCAICDNTVTPGPAWMRKAGETWQVAHSYHGDIAST